MVPMVHTVFLTRDYCVWPTAPLVGVWTYIHDRAAKNHCTFGRAEVVGVEHRPLLFFFGALVTCTLENMYHMMWY
jgi:hypothetical protein